VTTRRLPVHVRLTEARDDEEITGLCRLVYPDSPPWRSEQLASHRRVFPEGQFVAVEPETGRIVGMAASLVVLWSDYSFESTWRDFTANGMFTNHDPNGRTLYGAEVLVRPDLQRRGVGAALYRARRKLCERRGLLRIRAAARLRGYHRYASKMSAEEYVMRVVRGMLKGPTLSFQLRHGFRVLAVVSHYLQHDPESLGNAAVIEWLNPGVASPEDWAIQDPRFDPATPLPT
jgi:GNAT superfamily N-acetyltransferase